jgi:hypothetical protein
MRSLEARLDPLQKLASEEISMKKDLSDTESTKRGKPQGPAKEKNPARAEEISDAGLDKVTGGVVGPCDHVRNIGNEIDC